ncbi:TetR family transcriptional regulator [Xanthobacter autotrophicus]|uniref:TetR/AcrR family transcriptional regulator n=1 Tax=Xanthobacter autotrophicus TaxID=280 RepID=UPI0037265DFA
MPRLKQYDHKDALARAMERFWAQGYYATSIDDLVRATGVSRHGLYAEFGDKRGLFVAVMETYCATVVTPAFARVEAEGAGLSDIRAYFDTQIGLAVAKGLPGPGCLIANTMTESGPHDEAFAALVRRHLERLDAGFRNALRGACSRRRRTDAADVDSLARFLTIAAQGLWSVSRVTPEPGPLRAFVDDLLRPIEERLAA